MKKFVLPLSLMAMAALLCVPFQVIAADGVNPDSQNQNMQSSGHGSADQSKSDRAAAEERVDNAIRLFNEGVAVSNSIPASVMARATGLAVIPKWTKAALIAGGSYGSGVFLAKQDNDKWSNPLFVSLTGGSVGAQVGLKSSDLILVFTNRNAIDKLANGQDFTLGVDASVSAGDTDKQSSAAIKDAQILTYERSSSGLFAGASLDGTVLKIQKDPTLAYYSLPDRSQEARGYYGKEENSVPLYNQIIGSSGHGTNLEKAVVPDSADRLKKAVDKFVTSIKDRPKQ